MKNLNFLIKFLFLLLSFTLDTITQSQVKLSTDFTNETDKKLAIHDFWNVANRISPRNGSNIRPGLKMNIVRMVGGINKTKNNAHIQM